MTSLSFDLVHGLSAIIGDDGFMTCTAALNMTEMFWFHFLGTSHVIHPYIQSVLRTIWGQTGLHVVEHTWYSRNVK